MKREEAKDINQDKKAMAAEREYLLQIFRGHGGTLATIKICATLAVELAAPSERNDNT